MRPVLIDPGFWQVPSYGVLLAGGYLAAILWVKARRAELGLSEAAFWNLIYALFAGALAGGKLVFLLVEWRALLDGRLRLFADFRYGFVFYGGVLGSVAACWWLRRGLPLGFLGTADYFGVALPLGHALGRFGCLAAGCCHGRPTSLPWGVVSGGHPASSTPDPLWGIPLHPAPLYESAANVLIALWVWRRVLPRVRSGVLRPGGAGLAYVVLYAAARFGVEFFRADDRGMAWGLSVSQWVSLGILTGAAAGLGLSRIRRAVPS